MLQIRRQQPRQIFCLFTASFGQVVQLVITNFANVKVSAVWMAEHETADAGSRRHGQAFRQCHANVTRTEKLKHVLFYAVVGQAG